MNIRFTLLFISQIIFLCVLPAQNVRVVTQNNLTIGRIEPGEAINISPANSQAAKFMITAEKSGTYSILFTLPSFLLSLSGNAELPVHYDGSSAMYSTTPYSATGTFFDPRQNLILYLKEGTPLYLWLGIQSHPAKFQQAGNYAANITLSVQLQKY